MAGLPLELEVDVSDLRIKIDRLRMAMKPQQFENAMYGIYKRTGGHVRKILQTDLPRQYVVKKKDIKAAVQDQDITSYGGGYLGCSIPIKDHRGSIGGRYIATGSARGWASLRKKYRVKGRIVRGKQSTLPGHMSSYGGQPPFRNSTAPKLNGVTFTRAGKARLPIEKVVGIAIPQMPMNRSQADVQQDIHDYLANEMERRFMTLMRIGR